MKLGTAAIGLALALGTATAGAAGAGTVTIGSYNISDTTFGSGFGVHADGTQSGGSILAHVDQDGSAVTFTSDDALSWTGGGEAILKGPFDDLNVAFAKGWSEITFAFDAGASTGMALAIDGAPVFDAADCSICTLSRNGEQKFTVTGAAIDQLAFTFTDAAGAPLDILNAKQFRVDGAVASGGSSGGAGGSGGPVGGGGGSLGGGLGGGAGGGLGGVPAVPEPATWALMVLGVGLTGFAARRRRTAAAVVA